VERGAENAGVEIAGVENTGAKTYGKPSEQKIKNSHQLKITDSISYKVTQ